VEVRLAVDKAIGNAAERLARSHHARRLLGPINDLLVDG